ncbi:MAG TPA: ASCH domain-containing protein [Aggregatilinea sp.]|uniref:ASCH domain-containing protein n=1 Tax=Aggregatilinea sp. TaxID=2806333 RepID=UPI002CCB8054|nr:ASCH domain-containing protein [Aggregatilinea sp.]HML21862.1 ASCH domain-containing protein [Aggregatilinea sp.]
MLALSLWQPYASMIALGHKTHETRDWSTRYRGLLAIHAARRWTAEERAICASEPVASILAAHQITPDALPRGAVLCIVRLVDVVTTEQAIVKGLDPVDRALGNYAPGRFAWVLELVRVAPEPVPVRGEKGLWDWRWR